MAGVFSTQRLMEDATMRDASMMDVDDAHHGDEDQYYDPMDISPLPASREQSQTVAPPMGLSSDQNTSRPDYWVHFTPPKSGGVPKATLINGPPMPRAPLIRPLARFSPKARIDPATGRFQQQFIAQPFLHTIPTTFTSQNKTGTSHWSHKPNVLASTDKYRSIQSSNILRSLSYKPVTIGKSVPTTRDSSFNSLLTTKSIWDRKTSSFASNTSITTATSSNSRKRSVDEDLDEHTQPATPETDSPSTKYRRVSQGGFPECAITTKEEVQKAEVQTAPAQEAPSTHAVHPTLGQPIVSTTTSTVQSDAFSSSQHTTAVVTLADDTQVSTPHGTFNDQTGHPSRGDNHVPGEWPEQYSDDLPATVALTDFLLRPGEEPLMSGALGVPSAATPFPAAVESLNADHEEIPDLNAPDGNVQNGQTPNMAVAYWETYHTFVKGTVKNVFTKALDIFARPIRPLIEYVRRYRRLQTPRRTPSSPRASPTRAAALRRLPEEQRRMIKDHEWRKQRGYPTTPNLPFPDLNFDIPQFPTSGSPSSREKPGDSVVESHAKPAWDSRQQADRITQRTDNYRAKTGFAMPMGVQKSRQVKSVSPNLKRRLWQGRDLERGKRELALQKALRTGDFSEFGGPSRTRPVKHEDQPVPKAQSKPKQKKRVHFKDPPAQFFPEPTFPELAPYLHPASPNVDRIGSKKVFAEQKENVPPVAAPEDEEYQSTEDLWDESIEYPLGRPVSAVSLFYPEAKPLPPGRTESIYAEEWRKIEEEEKRKQSPARVRPEGPAVRPLSGEWVTRMSHAMAASTSRAIATSVSGDPLTKKDLSTCFTPLQWLNDEVINSYLALLVDYLRRTNHNNGRNDKPRYHAFTTFFFSNLRDKGYQSVRRWATRAKVGGESLLDVDTVFVPVHNSAHWTLIVIKPMERTIEHFDSLGQANPRHVAIMKDWLRNELGPRYAEEEWRVLPSVSPQQDNGSDCGVFLLSTAKAVAIGLEPLSYCARDIVLLRKKIVAELMAGGLEGDFDPASGGEVLL
ncbi:hypothetical protein BDV28DRAFT_126565 [Aspergillus coremiiformis]|uniref:Ubiquitin-like protease family profile domain-containing protein n=1 Tax=Aspergillus coremiiformis TaxID=138285 RepID=A0A5N6ZGQ8_9EURO|nr:hypothetical protein BDV28DRAFT_126565 [Aspergillus coremiiformis]